jgi:hypothetical protein
MSERPVVLGSAAPHQLNFDRSSGLPLGYFDQRRRPWRWRLVLLIVIAFLL